MESPGTAVIDIVPRFSDGDKGILFTDKNGLLLYNDSTHISGAGAELVKVDIFNAIKSVGLPRTGAAEAKP